MSQRALGIFAPMALGIFASMALRCQVEVRTTISTMMTPTCRRFKTSMNITPRMERHTSRSLS